MLNKFFKLGAQNGPKTTDDIAGVHSSSFSAGVGGFVRTFAVAEDDPNNGQRSWVVLAATARGRQESFDISNHNAYHVQILGRADNLPDAIEFMENNFSRLYRQARGVQNKAPMTEKEMAIAAQTSSGKLGIIRSLTKYEANEDHFYGKLMDGMPVRLVERFGIPDDPDAPKAPEGFVNAQTAKALLKTEPQATAPAIDRQKLLTQQR